MVKVFASGAPLGISLKITVGFWVGDIWVLAQGELEGGRWKLEGEVEVGKTGCQRGEVSKNTPYITF